LPPPRRCTVGGSWRRTPAQSSEALNNSAAQWETGLLIGVRWHAHRLLSACHSICTASLL